jgi:hypothetical protein
VQRRAGAAAGRGGDLGEPERVALGPDLLGGQEDLLELVDHEAGSRVGAGHGERGVVTPPDVRPQDVAELDEALVGFAERSEPEPGALDGNLLALRIRPEHEAVPIQDEATTKVAHAGHGPCREARELFHSPAPSFRIGEARRALEPRRSGRVGVGR